MCISVRKMSIFAIKCWKFYGNSDLKRSFYVPFCFKNASITTYYNIDINEYLYPKIFQYISIYKYLWHPVIVIIITIQLDNDTSKLKFSSSIRHSHTKPFYVRGWYGRVPKEGGATMGYIFRKSLHGKLYHV